MEKLLWALLGLFLFVPLVSMAGNGSGSVGSAKIPIADGINANLPEGAIVVAGSSTGWIIVDSKTKQPILKFKRVPATQASGLVPAKLGAVSAYEHIPRIDHPSDLNHWIICGADGCLKFEQVSPESQTRAAEILGSLSR